MLITCLAESIILFPNKHVPITKITSGFLEDFPTVDALKERHDLSPKEYAKFAMEWVEMGATIIGGCCEVGPRHIEQLAKELRDNGHTIV
mgnify:CR=1 FL=1